MSYATSAAGDSANGAEAPVRRRGRILIPTLVVLATLTVVLVVFTGFYTDFLWFRSMGNGGVFTRQLSIRAGLFVAFGLIMFAGIGLSMLIAYRTRPTQRVRTPEQLSLERYRAGLEPMRKPLGYVIPILIGLLAGAGLLMENWNWRTFGLLVLCVWGFCRYYYFAFYVVEKYVDGQFKFSSLWAFAVYLKNRWKRSS